MTTTTTKLSQRSDATTPLTGTEVVYVNQGGRTKKTPVSAIKSYCSGVETVLVDSSFTGDCSATVNSAIASGNTSLRFTRGTYSITSDITIPSNTYIVVDEGAVINCTAARWTGYLSSNVIFEINGTINALSYTSNAALNVRKGSWPQYAVGVSGTNQPRSVQNLRGFIELGGITTYLQPIYF